MNFENLVKTKILKEFFLKMSSQLSSLFATHWIIFATHDENSSTEKIFKFNKFILLRLSDQEANEGKQVVLKCKINCTPPPNIAWFKGGNDITKDPRVKSYKDPNGFDCLNINSASRGMAGEYEIKATNDMGTAACKCTIKVNSMYSFIFPFC